MSVNYAEQLSPYPNKGKCGNKEIIDPQLVSQNNIKILHQMIKDSNHTVVLTGAGISTSCGIPDFRGPNGVWTLENKGIKCETSIRFETAEPSLTHYALSHLQKLGHIQYLISQNVDGLHLKSGFPSQILAEIHGNIFARKCHSCNNKVTLPTPSPTLGLKFTGEKCHNSPKGRTCRGRLKDTILDWEDELPGEDLRNAEKHSKNAKLFICLGTSLQIFPCGSFPRIAKKYGSKLVIINLQKTRYDKLCDLRIHSYVDDVMKAVMEHFEIPTGQYVVTGDG